MSLVAFDALGYFEKLKEAGVPEAQAKVQANALREYVNDRESAILRELATKRDIVDIWNVIKDIRRDVKDIRGEMKDIRGEMKADIQNLRDETKANIQSLRGEIKDISVDMDKMKADIQSLSKGLIALDEKVTRRIESFHHEMIKWMLGLFIGQIGLIIGFATYLKN